MIPLPTTTRIFLACGATDMRKGFDGLAVMVQQVLEPAYWLVNGDQPFGISMGLGSEPDGR